MDFAVVNLCWALSEELSTPLLLEELVFQVLPPPPLEDALLELVPPKLATLLEGLSAALSVELKALCLPKK